MKTWFKRVFIPHNGNNYAPHSLQKAAVGGMVALILISFTLTNVQSIIWIASDWMVSTILPAVIIQKTNQERSGDSLGTLRRNSVLDEAARLKAEDMAKNEYFAHYSPTGVSPWYWFATAGYNYVHAGENLAIHFTDSGEVIKAWMDSPTHRANIMNGNYVEIGVGTAEGEYQGFSTVYVVQLFGTPAAAAAVAGESVVVPVAATESTLLPTEPIAVSSQTNDDPDVLASDVEIEETIEIIPAAVVAEVVPTVALPSSTDPMALTDMEVTDNGVALYSDFVSTSTGGVAATLPLPGAYEQSTVPVVYSALTQPQLVLQILYGIIGSFVLFSLVLSIFIEIRRQQPLQIAYGLLLFMLMSSLFYVHAILTTGAVVV